MFFATQFLGPPTYVSYYGLKARCLAQIFKEHGYKTLWFHALDKSYHHMDLFESLHGVDHFFDTHWLQKRNIAQKIGQWGVGDQPFLQEVVQELQKTEGPFFGTALTISTHHPHEILPEGPVQGEVLEYLKHNQKQAGYLSHLSYLDQALGDFFESFFKLPQSDDTLIVLASDHGIPVETSLELTEIQKHEIEFRVPIVLISKNLKIPRKIKYPIHQMDIAPTVLEIAGLHTKTSFLGKNALNGSGTNWLYRDTRAMHFRLKDRVCYTLFGTQRPRCFVANSQTDPLFDPRDLPTAELDPKTYEFLESVILANHHSIVLNALIE